MNAGRCSCGTPGLNYAGPEIDCPIHGEHQTCPTPVTAYTVTGSVTIPRSVLIPLVDAAVEFHETCDPADPSCPWVAARRLVRGYIDGAEVASDDVMLSAVYAQRLQDHLGDVVFVDSWPIPGSSIEPSTTALHVHLRVSGRCVRNDVGDHELCGGGS